jgi:hypothetical protein
LCQSQGDDYPAPPPDPQGWDGVKREASEYLRETLGSPFYRLLFIAWGLGSTAWSGVNSYGVLFATSFISTGQYDRLLTLTFFISFLLAYPLGALADRFIRCGWG